MPPSRRKAPAQIAPQTIEQAVAALSEYRDILDKIDELAAETRAAIGRIEATRDHCAAPLQARAVDLFRQLRAWWAVGAPELTDGKRKSTELAGCLIGERTTPPALQLPRGVKVEEIVAMLLDELAGDYLATSHKLDKPAIIKALRLPPFEPDPREADEMLLAHELGVLRDKLKLAVVQKEEFFIDRPRKEPDPQVVPEAEDA